MVASVVKRAYLRRARSLDAFFAGFGHDCSGLYVCGVPRTYGRIERRAVRSIVKNHSGLGLESGSGTLSQKMLEHSCFVSVVSPALEKVMF